MEGNRDQLYCDRKEIAIKDYYSLDNRYIPSRYADKAYREAAINSRMDNGAFLIEERGIKFESNTAPLLKSPGIMESTGGGSSRNSSVPGYTEVTN